MGDNISGLVASVLTAIIGVAILAVLVSQNSNTTGVIQALAGGFSSILGVAVSPVTGGGGGFGSGGGFGNGFGGGSGSYGSAGGGFGSAINMTNTSGGVQL